MVTITFLSWIKPFPQVPHQADQWMSHYYTKSKPPDFVRRVIKVKSWTKSSIITNIMVLNMDIN